jgi:hypothetical protein
VYPSSVAVDFPHIVTLLSAVVTSTTSTYFPSTALISCADVSVTSVHSDVIILVHTFIAVESEFTTL